MLGLLALLLRNRPSVAFRQQASEDGRSKLDFFKSAAFPLSHTKEICLMQIRSIAKAIREIA